MYLPAPTQPDCGMAWLEGVRQVDAMKPGHQAHNVVIDVADPVVNTTLANPIVRAVNDFLSTREKSVDTIANTIFPEALYRLHGHPQFIKVFHEKILPKVRKNEKWSGYYFERMTSAPDQLSKQVERLSKKSNKALHKFELSLFSPERERRQFAIWRAMPELPELSCGARNAANAAANGAVSQPLLHRKAAGKPHRPGPAHGVRRQGNEFESRLFDGAFHSRGNRFAKAVHPPGHCNATGAMQSAAARAIGCVIPSSCADRVVALARR